MKRENNIGKELCEIFGVIVINSEAEYDNIKYIIEVDKYLFNNNFLEINIEIIALNINIM